MKLNKYPSDEGARAAAEVARDTGWVDDSNLTEGDLLHTRTIGEFVLNAWNMSDGWSWSAEWGDNDIAEGEVTFTRADHDSGDAWGASLPRAKRACEAAARKAGIAVPAEVP